MDRSRASCNRARGIFGQHIHVYPADDLVIVTNAFTDDALASFDYSLRLFDGARRHVPGTEWSLCLLRHVAAR